MPGILAVVSNGDVHASVERRARTLCVEPWMTATCEEVLPGVVTIGGVSTGIFDAGRPPLARDGNRFAAVDGYLVVTDDLRNASGIETRSGDADLVLALAAAAPATDWAGRLQGNFTILVWDGDARTLTLVSDRHGFRPHYVGWDGRNLVVGPSVRFVLGFPWVSADLRMGSVVEQFAFQYVLEDRTCFRDVEVLPAHAVTTVTVEPRRLHTERTWSFDRVPVRDDVRFEDAVEESLSLFRRAFRRHVTGPHRHGIPLSGGMDSRILLAAAVDAGRRLPTFTFGLRDSRDVSGARAMSRRVGVENHAFVFESGDWVRDLADRHVELTDGMHGLFHAHGLHMARHLRERIDVGLSGLMGGLALGSDKLLRTIEPGGRDWSRTLDAVHAYERKEHGIGFVDPGDLRALFTQDVWRDSSVRPPREALGAALEPLRGCRSESIPQFSTLMHRERKQLVYMLAFARPYYETSLPYGDHDLLDFGLSLPVGLRRGGRLQRVVLERLAPCLAEVRETRTNRPPTRRAGPRRAWKAGRRLRSAARMLSGGRLCPRSRKYDTAYDDWLRRDLADWARSILLDPRTLGRGLFDPTFVRRVLEPPTTDGRARTWQVGMMLSFELMLRFLVDGVDAPAG